MPRDGLRSRVASLASPCLIGDRAVNTWHYEFTPNGSGNRRHRVVQGPHARIPQGDIYSWDFWRKRRNLRDMRTTLERVKAVVEA